MPLYKYWEGYDNNDQCSKIWRNHSGKNELKYFSAIRDKGGDNVHSDLSLLTDLNELKEAYTRSLPPFHSLNVFTTWFLYTFNSYHIFDVRT